MTKKDITMVKGKNTKLDGFLEEWRKDHKKVKSSNKSYSHKPHLAKLPHDRRSTSWSELKERFEACKEKCHQEIDEVMSYERLMQDCVKDIKEYQKLIDENNEELKEWRQDIENFEEADQKVYDKKREMMDNVVSQMDVVLPDEFNERINELRSKLIENKKGYFTDEEQLEYVQLSGDIKNWLLKQEDKMDITPRYANGVNRVADTLATVGSNGKKLTDLYEKMDEHRFANGNNKEGTATIEGLLDNTSNYEYARDVRKDQLGRWSNEHDKHLRLSNDYLHEGQNTAKRCRDLGFEL